MTKVFILILTIRFVDVEAVPVQFLNFEECEAAGQAWVNSMVATQGWFGGQFRYLCVHGQVMP